MMENKLKMTFGSAYEAPDVQVTEVLVEKGFEASLNATADAGSLDYGQSSDFNEFE